MEPPHRAFHFPDDVLRLIVDSLSLRELVRLSRVSRAWRSVARDHPTYSRNISLCLERPDHSGYTLDKFRGSIQLFIHRIFYRHSMGSIVSLVLDVADNLTRSQLAVCAEYSAPFGTVYECLERLFFLSARVHWRFLPALCHALSMRRAPRLREFRLWVEGTTSSMSSSWILPDDLFACHAPNLVKLRLGGPIIPPLPSASGALPVSPLPAFAAVKEVRFELGWLLIPEGDARPILRLELFFAHCPMLERLVLRCTDAVYLHRAQTWSALPAPENLGLKHLSFLGDAIHYPRDDSDFEDPDAWEHDVDAVVRAFAHPAMATFEVNTNAIAENALLSILAHFGSDTLELEATTRDAYYSRLTLRSIPRGIERTFCQLLSYSDQTDQDMFNKCLRALVPQLVHLTIHRHYDIWDVIVRILSGPRSSRAALPRVEKLTVVLGYEPEDDVRDESDRQKDASYGAFPGRHQLQLPALRSLELRGPNSDKPLTVDDVASFMGAVLGRTASRDLHLILRGVTIEGDIRRIWGYFKTIEMLPLMD